MDQNIKTLQQWIDESQRIVFFGGAGVSTESGIPDFRSVDGLYNQSYAYPPETILSHSFFAQNPEEFYRFYREKMLIRGAKPNPAHLKLAELEQAGKLTAVVTQNIHAGSVPQEVHGVLCLALHAVVAQGGAVELVDGLAAGGLVEAVDVLGNDSFEAPLLLPLGQFPVGRIGLRIQNQHLIAVKTIKFLRIPHEKSVA